jgi:hypothetical protein
VAFPSLPALPPLSRVVDPDRWLDTIHGQAFVRRVGSDGGIEVDHESSSIGLHRVRQQVTSFVNSPERLFDVYQGPQQLKQLPIKRWHGGLWPFERDVTLIEQEARSQKRRALHTQRQLGQLFLWRELTNDG